VDIVTCSCRLAGCRLAWTNKGSLFPDEAFVANANYCYTSCWLFHKERRLLKIPRLESKSTFNPISISQISTSQQCKRTKLQLSIHTYIHVLITRFIIIRECLVTRLHSGKSRRGHGRAGRRSGRRSLTSVSGLLDSIRAPESRPRPSSLRAPFSVLLCGD